jgi:hypothetical protein
MKKITYNLLLIACFFNSGYSQTGYPFRTSDNQAILAYWYNCRPDSAFEAGASYTAHIHSTFQIYGPVPADSFLVKAQVFISGDKMSYENEFHVTRDMKSTTFRTEIINNFFVLTIPVAQLKENPAKIRIIISSPGMKIERSVNCKYHRIYGDITDFRGKALKSYVLIRSDGFDDVSGVWSDQDGHYEIYLPERTYNCFYINDGNYRISTLEAWAWHMIVDQDQQLDFKIGTGEVYNLNAWASNGGSNSLLVSFRPMALWYRQSTDTIKELNNKVFKVIDIAPELDLNQITVTINGNKVEQYSIQKYFETGKEYCMPAYIIQVRRLAPTFGKQTIRLEYEKEIEKDGKKLFQNSMGYYQFYPNFYGFSDFN